MILDLIFGSQFSSIFFFLVDVVLAAVSFRWWKKYQHRDYYWLFALWSTLIASKIAQYIFATFSSSIVYTLPYTEGLLVIPIFYTIRAVVNWVATFYILLIMFKWVVPWTPERGRVVGAIMNRKGILIVSVVSIVANIAISLYLTELWLK